jgi:hypothetical protein
MLRLKFDEGPSGLRYIEACDINILGGQHDKVCEAVFASHSLPGFIYPLYPQTCGSQTGSIEGDVVGFDGTPLVGVT